MRENTPGLDLVKTRLRRGVNRRQGVMAGAMLLTSFPNSVWERPAAKLCFAATADWAPSPGRFAETEFRGRAFPNGVWERERHEIEWTMVNK